jgi:broad specificity phosphatase PhoE
MPVVHLVRHGQASFGAADYDVLSDAGRRQAEVLGRDLARRGVRPDRVVTGSLSRQRDTATALLDAAGLDEKPDVDERWNEYDHLALLAHHRSSEVLAGGSNRFMQQALDEALGHWVGAGECADCARPWPLFRDETTAALDELLTSLGSGGVGLVVTSGGVIAAVCAALLGMPPESLITLNRVVVNAAVTKVVSGKSGTSLLSFNDHSHLEQEDKALVTFR